MCMRCVRRRCRRRLRRVVAVRRRVLLCECCVRVACRVCSASRVLCPCVSCVVRASGRFFCFLADAEMVERALDIDVHAMCAAAVAAAAAPRGG